MLEIIKMLLLFSAGYCAAMAQVEYRKQREKKKEPKIHGYTKKELIRQGKKDVKAAAKSTHRIRELKAKIAARERTLEGMTQCPAHWLEDLEEWKVELEMLKCPKTGCSSDG